MTATDDLYTPYKVQTGEWFFDNCRYSAIGPFLTEESCAMQAKLAEERDAL